MRIAFAAARVPWGLADEFQAITVNSIRQANLTLRNFKDSMTLSSAAAKKASMLAHPSRRFSTPYLRYSDALEQQIRTRIERPLSSRLLSFHYARQRRKVRSLLPKDFVADLVEIRMQMWEEEESAEARLNSPGEEDPAAPPPSS
jgi:hypothetical protein